MRYEPRYIYGPYAKFRYCSACDTHMPRAQFSAKAIWCRSCHQSYNRERNARTWQERSEQGRAYRVRKMLEVR